MQKPKEQIFRIKEVNLTRTITNFEVYNWNMLTIGSFCLKIEMLIYALQ